MPIAQAVRLCPAATFFQGSFIHYRDASRAVRAVLQRFSPTVVMASLDEAYLDFAGTDRLYPVSLLPVAERIRDAVRARDRARLQHRHRAQPHDRQAGLRPRQAARAHGSAGRLGRRISRGAAARRRCPVSGPRRRRAGPSWGSPTCIRCSDGPRAALARLVGGDARGLKRRAHGHGGSTLRGDRLPKSVSRETTLSRDLRDPEELEAILVAPHRAGGRAASRGTTGGAHGDAQAPARRLPHRHPAAHAGDARPTSTPSSTRRRGRSSGRRSRRCAAGTGASG